MELDKNKLDRERGFAEGGPDAVDAATAAVVPDYKANVCKQYISLNAEQIETRLGGTSFFVTRKYDGELAVIFWNGEDLFTINTGGRVRLGLPCHEEAARLLKAAGVREAVIPAELYTDETAERTRVFEVLAALADRERHDRLRLAPFDLLRLDGEPFRPASFAETYQKLTALFGNSAYCRPVRCQTASGKGEVKALFSQWVSEEGAEGLVVRSELPLIYKIKPRYSLDLAVVGFSEGLAEARGQVRSLLLALMPEEGVYQIVGRTGTGFDEEMKKQLFAELTPMIMDSQYIETDSNHVAFHMIRPELVVELLVNDVLFEGTGGPIPNPLLEIQDGRYRRVGSVFGLSLVFPIFVRRREDKSCNAQDVRLSQVESFAYNPLAAEDEAERGEQAASQVLRRAVYKKETGTKLMVQKFQVWKTNKEHTGEFPAYVFHYVNFSSERKDPLSTEALVSSSAEQIMAVFADHVAANVKKGWQLVEDSAG
ncbi:MAG: hypothetical protein LBK56_04800 [Gracilibacteraceae bacterium]|jgi:hypothetical protein|nr:hypothetical protein [Gracilibacteraceae bacterium]